MTTKGIAPNPPRIRVGDEFELTFHDLLVNGQGVGRLGSLAVFCWGPLPQERALVRITTLKARYAVATQLRLLSGSPHRVVPFCAAFGTCGGCQVQHMSYPAQLSWKREVVHNALRRIGGLHGIDVRNVLPSPRSRRYRNKVALVVGGGGEQSPPGLGFFRQRTHELVEIESCPILVPELDEIVGRLHSLRLEERLGALYRVARHFVARASAAIGESVLSITTDRESPEIARVAAHLLERLPRVRGIANSFDPASANAVMGREQRTLAGATTIEETIAGVRYRVSPESFFQVNPGVVAKIFALMRGGLAQPRKIVDLYCGAGTFSLYFAAAGSTVLGIEENPAAVREAEANAELNGLQDRVEFEAARVEEAVGRPEIAARLREAEILFLDPPRKGSDEATLGAIVRARVPNIWYLSCDPATLARDLKFLTSNGYNVGIVQPFDMFPQTGHVETLVTLYCNAREIQAAVEAAFADTPPPEWPDDDQSSPTEYPDFVIRES